MTVSARPWISAHVVAFIASALALLMTFSLLVHARAEEPLALDQGLFACFGAWPELLPYRDIFDSKPPLFLYAWTFAWRLGGGHAAGMWRVEVAWLGISMLLAFALATRLWGRMAGLVAAAALLFGLWSPVFGGWWSRAQAEELLVVPMLGAAWLALRAVERPRWAWLAGVLTGLSGLFKIPALSIAGAWLLLWFATAGARGGTTRAARMAAGAALPWIAVAAFFHGHGALRELYEGVLQYHRYNAEYIAPPWLPTVASFARTYAEALAWMFGASAIGVIAEWRRDRALAWWLLGWTSMTLAAVLLQRQLAGYHFLLAVPPLALATAAGVYAVARVIREGRDSGLTAAGVGALIAALLIGFGIAPFRAAYGPGLAYRSGDISRTQYLRTFPIALPATEESIARYLRERTAERDSILVWGLSPGIYALSGRRPATRYPFHKILMTEAPLSKMIPGLTARRAELMGRLASDPPAYILVGHDDSNGFEPQDSVAGMWAFEALSRFVVSSYREEARIGAFALLRRAR